MKTGLSGLAIIGSGISIATIGTVVGIIAGILTIILVSWQLYDRWKMGKSK